MTRQLRLQLEVRYLGTCIRIRQGAASLNDLFRGQISNMDRFIAYVAEFSKDVMVILHIRSSVDLISGASCKILTYYFTNARIWPLIPDLNRLCSRSFSFRHRTRS